MHIDTQTSPYEKSTWFVVVRVVVAVAAVVAVVAVVAACVCLRQRGLHICAFR